MSSERRRRRSRQRRLRRFISEKRLTAAEGVLASAGLAIGLWLFWPDAGVHQPGQGHAALPTDEAADLFQIPTEAPSTIAGGLLPAAQASVSMSAKQAIKGQHVTIGSTGADVNPELRLPQVAESMPEIGLVNAPDALSSGPPSEVQAGAADIEEKAPSVVPPDPVPTVEALPEAVVEAEPRLKTNVSGVPAETAPNSEQVDPNREPSQLAALGVTPETPVTAPSVVAPDPQGPRPSVGTPGSGVPNWVRNAAAAPAAGDQRPMIAIVIDDLGPSPGRTFAVSDLRAPLTLAFLPYASGLPDQTAAARRAGHELMVHMPMEPEGSESPGPDALRMSLSDREFQQRLIKNLDVFEGSVGLNNHMGSRLTRDPHRMALVMAELRRRDLLFVDSRTTSSTVGPVEALRHGVPFAARDVFLDNQPDLQHVMKQLEQLELTARRNGMAIGIGHPNDATLQALRRWLPTLPQRGFRLVPVSSIVARNSCVEPAAIEGCGSIREPDPSRTVAGEPRADRG